MVAICERVLSIIVKSNTEAKVRSMTAVALLQSVTPQIDLISQQPISTFIQLRSVERLIVFSAFLGITASQTAVATCIPRGCKLFKSTQ